MILEKRFHAQSRNSDREFADLELPDHVEIEPGLGLRFEISGDRIALIFQQQVDHLTLSRVMATRYAGFDRDDTVEYPCVEVAVDHGHIREKASDIVACLALLLETRISLFGAGQADRIVPENVADEQKIQELGADQLYFGLKAGPPYSRTARGSMTDKHILDLLPRAPGLHLYADAIQNAVPTAEFRDYWRVLESAFNVIEDDLVTQLGRYPPSIAMGFDEDELKSLLVLRGRASHAKSRIGLSEKKEVDALCLENLPRLKALAKEVILTKKSWGYPTPGVEEAQPYIRISVSSLSMEVDPDTGELRPVWTLSPPPP